MSNRWKIEYWAGSKANLIEKWILNLPMDQFKSLTKEIKILEEMGNELKLPHSKALGKGLFELRERRYSLRIYYTFHNAQLIILLTAGNKTSQEKDIKTARERLLILAKGREK